MARSRRRRWKRVVRSVGRALRRRDRRRNAKRSEPEPVVDGAPAIVPDERPIPLTELAAGLERSGYHFGRGEPVEEEIRRIVGQQLASALNDLTVVVVDNAPSAVHDCRRKCKKMRAALRLARPGLEPGQYRALNDLARDASRAIAPLRDAAAMTETFDTLAKVAENDERVNTDASAFRAVAEVLAERQHRYEGELDASHPAIGEALELLTKLDTTPLQLRPQAGGGWDVLGPGVARTYRRGRQEMDAAIKGRTGELFHQWRKRAKYTRYHLGILTPTAPAVLDPIEDAFHQLTDALGDGHDLLVIDEWLRSGDSDADGLGDLSEVHRAIEAARCELDRRAVELGRRLYAESDTRFAERLGAYWEIWQSDGAHRPAGGLAVIYA